MVMVLLTSLDIFAILFYTYSYFTRTQCQKKIEAF